ncbi:uncharacterized protein LOC128232588 [Mya arenaria]|uniref:uncharacterized protein LOC128232588 n=1 Tax=Mya arenaria TaxID=6604 RepID=UPI0022DF3C48|nr:uncharacterized protein LOC128232588 [Mya arenaria]XP_052802197.1 uncharacterized protein LOC128232588 [Mya arenaria]
MSDACKLKRKKAHAITCVILNMFLTFNFLLLITVWAVVRASLSNPQASAMCIPCDKTTPNTFSGPKIDHSTIKMRKDGMCCGPVESIAQNVLQKDVVEQYYEYRKNSASLLDILDDSAIANCQRETSNKHPMSKIVGIVEFKPSYIVNGHYKVLWNKNGRTFSANNCVHLEPEGEIFVRQPGYYIVSSQLNLIRQNETGTYRNETSPTVFSHHVDLFSQKFGTTGILMQTKKSIQRNDGFYTSFLSAVFKLNKNDRLSVSVSNPEYLEIDNPNDHFLVYYTYDLPY